MKNRIGVHTNLLRFALLILSALLWTSCNITKTVPEGQHLLRSNKLKVKSDKFVTRQGELKDNLERLLVQKPNYYMGISFNTIPIKLVLYNLNPAKYEKNTENFQLKSKTVERPVLYDSIAVEKSAQNIRNYLTNQGYFYAKVTDTVRFKKKKAFVTYNINTGNSYIISKVDFENGIPDSTIRSLVNEEVDNTGLIRGTNVTSTLFDEERSRITTLLRNNGYYKFSQENVSFQMDTVKKSLVEGAGNPIEGAISFLVTQRKQKNLTTDIEVKINKEEEPDAFKRYGISHVEIYPDYEGPSDFTDSRMLVKNIGGLVIKYHDYYVREKVIYKHTYLFPEVYFSQADYDNTISRLSELGIFQYVRIVITEDPNRPNFLICKIMMNKAKKQYFTQSIEFSNGSNYAFGTALTSTFRDINLAKGANLLTLSANGGIEMPFYDSIGNNFFEHFKVLTKYYGANASIDFPKFISPFNIRSFSNTNVPHTVISIGTNFLDRVDYFTLVNNNAGFTYTWRESPTKNWTFSPAFVNIIKLPSVSDTFNARLRSNEFLANSYKENFIEGENISFTFSDQEKKGGRNYSYMRLSMEEAGALLSGVNSIAPNLGQYAQYGKFDFDAQHQFTFRHSKIALRFTGGIGIPYGSSNTLPYVKQYFVGGPYSLRGWRVRTLGPGSSVDTTGSSFIDRTGDIKLELNNEYRFDIASLFAGYIKMDGAVFADAGNIWLSQKADKYPGGEFNISTFGQDIAADVGLGARFEIATFIVLRLDVGMPVKKPYVLSNGGWVTKDIDFSDPNWRSNNLVLNIALGYPF